MNYGLTYNQAALGGLYPNQPQQPQYYQSVQYAAPPAGYPQYAPSYSLPLQMAPQGLPAMQVDQYQSTRDKSVGDFAKGFMVGAGKSIYDMGHGIYFLGKTVGSAILHPIDTISKIGGAVVHGVSHPLQTAEAVVTLPFKVARGIVKPYADSFKQGQYGEAFGRLTVDVGVIALSLSGGPKPPAGGAAAGAVTPPPPPPTTQVLDKVDDVAKVVQPVTPLTSGGAVNASTQMGDVLVEKLVNIENVAQGATVNVTIGNIEIGKTVVSGVQGGLGGTAGKMTQVADKLDDVAQIVDKVDDVTKVVTPVTTITPAVTSPAVGTTVAGLEGTLGNIGSKLGRGIDKVVNLPGQMINGVSNGLNAIGNGLTSVGNAILHPIQTLKGINLVGGAEWIGNGLRTGADLTAKGLLYAAQNPGHALAITGAVGRAGKAGEDILKEFDLVR